MSKEKKKITNNNLEQMRKAIAKQEKLVAMACNHQKPNGDLNIKWINVDNGDVECKTCGTTFNMSVINDKELAKAQYVIHSAIQQIRATTSDDELDIVETFGKVAYALGQVPEEYSRLIEALGKNKKKKKKKKSSNIGGYGNALEVVRKNRGR